MKGLVKSGEDDDGDSNLGGVLGFFMRWSGEDDDDDEGSMREERE